MQSCPNKAKVAQKWTKDVFLKSFLFSLEEMSSNQEAKPTKFTKEGEKIYQLQ